MKIYTYVQFDIINETIKKANRCICVKGQRENTQWHMFTNLDG